MGKLLRGDKIFEKGINLKRFLVAPNALRKIDLFIQFFPDIGGGEPNLIPPPRPQKTGSGKGKISEKGIFWKNFFKAP